MFLQRFNFFLRPSGKIEASRGFRTLLALGVPIAVGHLVQQAEAGLSVGSFAQLLILADIGGLYETRAKSLIWATLGMTLAMLLGSVVSGSLVLTVIVVFLGLFATGYLTVYGENGAMTGLVIALSLLIAVSLPPVQGNELLHRAFLSLLGGSWSLFLALWIWPFRPNQPLLQTVAKTFQGIALYLRNSSYSLTATAQADSPSTITQPRQLLLQARQVLIDTRIGQWGRNELRELLIVLIEDCDRILTILVSIQEVIAMHPLPQLTTVSILLEDSFKQVAVILEDIGQLILGKNQSPDCDRFKLLLTAIEQQLTLQRKTLETDLDNYASYAAVQQIKTWLQKLQQQLQLASQTAQHLHDRNQWQTQSKPRKISAQELWVNSPKHWWEPLRENFNLESPLFRHGLRLGLGTAIGVLIYTFADIPHGLWICLTVLIVLKPDFSLTFQRFFFRIAGTLLGLVAVSLVLATIHNTQLLTGLAVISIAIALALVRFHYSLAVFFITIFAVILSQVESGAGHVNFVTARLIGTLLGAAIAFVLSFSFLRMKEEWRFSNAVIKAIEELNHYFQAVMEVYLGTTPYQPVKLQETRYKTRMANTTMQTALQRLLEDPNTPFALMEPAISLANYIPQLGRGITVLLTRLEQHNGSQPHPKLAQLIEQVTQTLQQFSQSLQENTSLPPLPNFDNTLQAIADNLQQLQEQRLTEIANHQEGTTTQQYLRDYNIVTQELEELVCRLEILHKSISRFETAV